MNNKEKYNHIKYENVELGSYILKPQDKSGRDITERLVFIPPLVGGISELQPKTFKFFSKRKCSIASFEYQGHQRSNGDFELQKAFEDTIQAYNYFFKYSKERRIPFHTMSTCFSTVTLLYTIANTKNKPESVNAVSGLFQMNKVIDYEKFLEVYTKKGGEELGIEQFLDSVESKKIDIENKIFRTSLKEFLQDLFPPLKIEENSFEYLNYNRVNIPKTLRQFHEFDPFKNLNLPKNLNYNFFYGIYDEILDLKNQSGRKEYHERIKHLIPNANIYPREIDHFGRGKHYKNVIKSLCNIFEGKPIISTE